MGKKSIITMHGLTLPYLYSTDAGSTEFAHSLCMNELILYRSGNASYQAFFNWRTRDIFVIQQSNVLKRRLLADSNQSNKRTQI